MPKPRIPDFRSKNFPDTGIGISLHGANRPFAASHSRGTKPLCWRAKVAPGQDKQRKLPFQIRYVFCLSCPSATSALSVAFLYHVTG